MAGLLCGAMLHGPVALAGPTGGQVVAGNGSIQRPNADTTLVQQQTRSMAIDWSGFDVAGHEVVKFQQPSSSAAVLNRVLNELPSQIHGRIEANGQVFIMNPNGVVFGPGSRVEVGALFASSLDIDVQDFMNGHYQFAAPEGATPGVVVNSGLIKAATGGSVALIGGAVRNDGVIVADLGHVLMGAGREALVDFDGDGLIRFHVDEAVLAKVSDRDGAVVNSGEIQADGGQVLLSASVARGIVDQAVNNQGVIRAASIDRSSGSVRLTAVGAGAVNAGRIDASASDAAGPDVHGGQVVIESTGLTLLASGSTVSARAAGGRGGEVRVLGESVAMGDAATIDVSGGLGGGTVLVGGDYQGANPAIANARRTDIAAGAAIDADAMAAGDGGRVIVWSDETTNFFGSISARGGASGGDGGFAEVSGKQHLTYRGSADLGAAAGERGTLLLDPSDIEIVGGSGTLPNVFYQADIEAQSATANITLQADKTVSTRGQFTGGALTLAPGSSREHHRAFRRWR
jgi:filamentous hemagglutinin family protein